MNTAVMLKRKISIIVVAVSLMCAGCYTKLMTPDELIKNQRRQSVKISGDYSSSLNYRQSCQSCHSALELTERSEDLEYYGIQTVHDGILLSTRLWNDESTDQPSIFYREPNPYWSNPYSTVNPWWGPAVIVGSTPVGSDNEQRRRTGGATSVTGDNSAQQNDVVPTYNPPPSTPTSATTTPSSTASPAVTTQQPQPTQQSTTEEGRRKKIPD